MHAIWCTVDGLLDSLVFPSKFHISYSNVGQIIVNFVWFLSALSNWDMIFLVEIEAKYRKKVALSWECKLKSENEWMNESVWCATNECVEILQSLMPKRWDMRAMRNHFIFLSFNGCLNPFRFFRSLFAKTICNGGAEHIYSVFSCSCKKSKNHKMTASLSRVVLLWKAINEIEYDALDNYYYGAAFNCHWGLFSHCQYHHI